MTATERPDALRLGDDDPWPGLAAYDESAQGFFHGRGEETAELLRLIRRSPIVSLYGKSGLGKSSMLMAGVFPQLRAARFLPVYLRLDYGEGAKLPLMEQAAQRLRQEAALAQADAEPFEPGETLWAYLQRLERPLWTSDNFPLTPVLVFDQFEEVFSRGGSPAHVAQALDELADLVADRLPAALAGDRELVRRVNLQSQQYRVVLSFRSDFLADVESWEKQANLPRHEALHLKALSRERAIDAVQKAGAKVVAPGVAEQIVDFLLQREGESVRGHATEVEPVLLSLSCYQLNRRRPKGGLIDATLLHTVGEGILKGFYDEALQGMPPRVSTFIEDNLIQGDRYRNAYALDEALDSGALTREELGKLTDSRLLRVDPQGEVPRIELIHDRLVAVVRDARDARRAGEAQQRERAAAERHAREERDRERLVQSENERRRIRRWRNGLAATVGLLLVATGWAVYFALGMVEANAIANDKADQLAQVAATAEAAADEARKAREAAIEQLDSVQQLLDRLQLANDTVRTAPAGGAVASSERAVADAAATVAIERVQMAKQEIEVAAGPAVARPVAADGSGYEASWRLTSGGCLKGNVNVTGTARFHLRQEGDQVVVSERFEGSGDGFTVVVQGVSRHARRSGAAAYDVETRGEWAGPNGRRFGSTGRDRVHTSDGVTPVRASFVSFRTVC